MKKQIAAVLMVLILTVVALAGCGGGGEQSPVVGEWKMTTIEVSGITMDMEEFIAATGQEDVNMSLTIEEDGNFSMDIAGQQTEGTWEYEEPVCTLTAEGESIEADYSDGKIVIDLEGQGTLTFEK